MPRPRSPNPGKVIGLYLRGEHLSTLRRFHEKPAHAIRILIEREAAPKPPPEPQTANPPQPAQRFEPSPMCERCERIGVPTCRACIYKSVRG
jgi:hypothetical protein